MIQTFGIAGIIILACILTFLINIFMLFGTKISSEKIAYIGCFAFGVFCGMCHINFWLFLIATFAIGYLQITYIDEIEKVFRK